MYVYMYECMSVSVSVCVQKKRGRVVALTQSELCVCVCVCVYSGEESACSSANTVRALSCFAEGASRAAAEVRCC
jgi:hypothetical protein